MLSISFLSDEADTNISLLTDITICEEWMYFEYQTYFLRSQSNFPAAGSRMKNDIVVIKFFLKCPEFCVLWFFISRSSFYISEPLVDEIPFEFHRRGFSFNILAFSHFNMWFLHSAFSQWKWSCCNGSYEFLIKYFCE